MNTTPIAAFDFDGTLTHKESLIQFIKFTHGFPIKLIRTLPTLLKSALGLASRQEAKEAILSCLYKNTPRSSLEATGQSFSDSILDNILNPEMMETLRWHQNQGHICVLVSANIDIYLVPWAKKHNFHHVICSQLETSPSGLITGKLAHPNCWGPEKARQLLLLISSQNYNPSQIYAYGDSRGDTEMLALRGLRPLNPHQRAKPFGNRVPPSGN
ncbi:MAG: HAD family hydrolase [Parachlamydiales bacterium]